MTIATLDSYFSIRAAPPIYSISKLNPNRADGIWAYLQGMNQSRATPMISKIFSSSKKIADVLENVTQIRYFLFGAPNDQFGTIDSTLGLSTS